VPLLSMDVASQLPGAPVLPIGDIMPPDTGAQIQIRNIEGIGPVKADISMAPFAIARGMFDQGSSTGSRNIVLTLGLNPIFVDGQNIATLRHQVYRYFMPELRVTFTFHSSELAEAVHIDGTVESVEPNIFSQDPEMQISVICQRPDFIGNTPNVVGPSNAADYETEIDYVGSVSNGFELEVTNEFADYAGQLDITLDNGPFHEEFKALGIGITPDQNFRVVTVATRRRVQYRDVSTDKLRSIMGRMWKGSSWPELQPGTNIFKCIPDFVGPAWTMTYWNRYGGL
jgi:hypothetical protein